MLPDAHGVIVTHDNALIMFTLQGRTVFEQEQGKQLLSVLFEAEAEAYRWLNATFWYLLKKLGQQGCAHTPIQVTGSVRTC
jgi:hypothetical protein